MGVTKKKKINKITRKLERDGKLSGSGGRARNLAADNILWRDEEIVYVSQVPVLLPIPKATLPANSLFKKKNKTKIKKHGLLFPKQF